VSVEALLAVLAALAGALGLSWFRGWRDRLAAEARLDRAKEAAQDAERRAREAEAAAARAEALRERERAQAAAQKEMEDGLGKVESDLPGAIGDALDESRRGGAA
jgi:hypothetical protein